MYMHEHTQSPRARDTPNLSRTNSLTATNQLPVRGLLFNIWCWLVMYGQEPVSRMTHTVIYHVGCWGVTTLFYITLKWSWPHSDKALRNIVIKIQHVKWLTYRRCHGNYLRHAHFLIKSTITQSCRKKCTIKNSFSGSVVNTYDTTQTHS